MARHQAPKQIPGGIRRSMQKKVAEHETRKGRIVFKQNKHKHERSKNDDIQNVGTRKSRMKKEKQNFSIKRRNLIFGEENANVQKVCKSEKTLWVPFPTFILLTSLT